MTAKSAVQSIIHLKQSTTFVERGPSDIRLVDTYKRFKRLWGKQCSLFKCTLKAQQICGELILSFCLKSEGRKCTRDLITFKENISNSIVSCKLEILKRVLGFAPDSFSSLKLGEYEFPTQLEQLQSLCNWLSL